MLNHSELCLYIFRTFFGIRLGVLEDEAVISNAKATNTPDMLPSVEGRGLEGGIPSTTVEPETLLVSLNQRHFTLGARKEGQKW